MNESTGESTGEHWDARVATAWSTAGELGHAALLHAIDGLVAEREQTDAAAVFEAASARD